MDLAHNINKYNIKFEIKLWFEIMKRALNNPI